VSLNEENTSPGSAATVFKGTWRGGNCVIKVMRSSGSEHELKQFAREEKMKFVFLVFLALCDTFHSDLLLILLDCCDPIQILFDSLECAFLHSVW
jgi:hypothetical protein